jgi:hypothetical protein
MMIGELEAETGTPASTIRYWERIGVLPSRCESAANGAMEPRPFITSLCSGLRKRAGFI